MTRKTYERSIHPKKCSKCRRLKPAEDFATAKHHRDGLYSSCNSCKKHTLDTISQTSTPTSEDLTCTKCGETKPAESFSVDRQKVTGRRSFCRECDSKIKAAYLQTEEGREVARKGRKRYAKTEKGKKAKRRATHKRRSSLKDSIPKDFNLAESCENCGSTEDLTLDHRIAVKLGGCNEEWNLGTLCRKCNGKKNAKPWLDWAVMNIGMDYEVAR